MARRPKTTTSNGAKLGKKFLGIFYASIVDELEDRGLRDLTSILSNTIPDYTPAPDHLKEDDGINFDSYIYKFISRHISFNEIIFESWAITASKFIATNVQHSNFVEIFANGLHYDAALNDCLLIDSTTRFLRIFMTNNFKTLLQVQRNYLGQDIEILQGLEEVRQQNIKSGADPNYRIDIDTEIRIKKRAAHRKEILASQVAFRERLTQNLPDIIPHRFELILRSRARPAIQKALQQLAAEIKKDQGLNSAPTEISSTAREVQLDSSFRSRAGRIPFVIAPDHIAISKTSAAPTDASKQKALSTQSTAPLVERAIADIKKFAVLDRLDNSDRILKSEIEDYIEKFPQCTTDDRVVYINMVGQNIERRLNINSRRDVSEKINDDVIYYIDNLMRAHDLFIQTFPISDVIAESAERSASLYKRFDVVEKTIPWRILKRASDETAIFDKKTVGTLRKAADALEDAAARESKGLLAIGFGLLRGALHAMATQILRSILDGAAEVTKERTKTLIGAGLTGLSAMIILFISRSGDLLSILANQAPEYFNWINRFIHLISL
jgi:hypothetical protein